MPMQNKLLIPDGMVIFFKLETTPGAPEQPLASDALKVREGLKFPSQPTSYSKAKEASATRSITSLMRDLRKAGALTVPTYFRPSGAAGTAPMEGKILEGLLPTVTTVPATSVKYEPAVAKPSFTLWLMMDNALVFCVGAVLTGGKFKGEGNGHPEADFELAFREMRFAGEDELSAAILDLATTIPVKDASKYCVGAPLKIGTSDNGGAGHVVTAVDLTLNELTVTPGVTGGQAIDSVVTPILPTPTNVGVPLDYRPAVKIAGTAIKWKGWEIAVAEPVAFVEGEVTEDPTLADYPSDHVAKAGREVTASVKIVMRTHDIKRLRADDTDKALVVEFAGVAGKKVKFTLPQGRLEVPSIESGDPAVEMTVGYSGRATTDGENEISILYE